MTTLRGAIALAVLLGCGCASVGPGTDTPAGDGAGTPDRQATGTLTRARTRVAGGQNGLEVCQWQVVDDPWRIADALRAHAAPAVAGSDELALRRNGFVVSAVRADELEALQRDLGGSAQDVRTWMGTAPAWRELVASPLGDAMLEIDGVARERPGGTVRLMARSWPLPMEDGGRITVEAVPQVVTTALQASLVRNGERLAGEVIGSCAMELELDRDVAWVITCDPSGVVEPKTPDAPPPEAPAAVWRRWNWLRGAVTTLKSTGTRPCCARWRAWKRSGACWRAWRRTWWRGTRRGTRCSTPRITR